MMSLTGINVATNNNYVKITYSSFGWKRGQIAYSCDCLTIEAIKISFRWGISVNKHFFGDFQVGAT